MENSELVQIDVEAVLKNKNPRLYRRTPRFLIRYLKRIAHQEEINIFMRKNREKKDFDFVDEVLKYLEIKSDVYGFENIPDAGRFVFAANHPLGGIESNIFMDVVGRKYRNVIFMVNDILMEIKPVRAMFIPVNKHGRQTREAVKAIDDLYKTDKQLLYFPAGLVSRRIKGEVVDLQWQKSFITKTISSKRDIIPVFIGGSNSNFFYRLYSLRKFFGIKANIEMLYLVNEMMKQKGQTIKIVFGKPISYTVFDKSKTPQGWANFVREQVYLLRG